MRSDFARRLSAGSRSRQRVQNIVVLGIRPTRAETGYGYIEAGAAYQGDALRVRRFTEKPDAKQGGRVRERRKLLLEQRNVFVECAHAGRCAAGASAEDRALCWRRSRPTFGTRKFAAAFRSFIPSAKTSAWIMRCWSRARQKASRQATFFACPRISGGTIWARGRRCTSITPRRAIPPDGNLIAGSGHVPAECARKLRSCAGEICGGGGRERSGGSRDPDALLITTRQQAQDVGKVVKYLDEKKMNKLT